MRMDTRFDFWVVDFDGTVVRVEDEYIIETLETVGSELDISFSPTEARRIWYGRDGLRNELLVENGIDPSDFWEAFHRIESPTARARATELHPDAAVIADVSDPIGVVTHCQSYLLEPILDRLDIDDWFDTIVCCSDELGWKPDPRPVSAAMTDLAVEGGDGALVGDSQADIQAAKNASLTSIFVDRNGQSLDVEADMTVSSLEPVFNGTA